MSGLSDAERIDEDRLIERAVAGDADAREVLIRQYLPAVYRVTYAVLGRRDLAEDAAQDAVLNALRALPGFRRESSFRTWLLRIAANAARSQGRRLWRRRERALADAEQLPAGGADAAALQEQRSELERVWQALAQLPPKQRLAVSLRLHEGLSYAEIAQASGSTEGAARVNYHLGIRRLRELLP